MFSCIRARLWTKGACPIPFIILCLTTLGSFAALFAAAKLIGHKQIAQLDFFDYITGITIGSIAAEMATELEEPWKPLTAILLYAGITLLLSVVTNKFPRTRRYLYGAPTILMDQGKLYRENLKKAKLDLNEFLVMCRQQGYFDLTTIQTAIFESNGKLTILPVSTQRPATPSDMNLTPEQESVFTEFIMDGRVLEHNLKHMGLDRIWLGKQLKQLGMLVIQDQVWNRVTVNRAAGKTTRYYVDEFHLLLKGELASWSVEIWKRFRKWGGIPTGITQNVKDLLSSREVENIFENSDFIYMLNQAAGDRQILAKQLNISPHQLSYVTHSGEGEGLLFFGNVILPFVDRFPTDLELYRIMTTKLGEVSEGAQK